MRHRRLTVAALSLGATVLVAACADRTVSPTIDAGARPTGEVNTMGMPVIDTPGSPSGSVTADGLTMEPAAWALGEVPLGLAVRPRWTIRNTGAQAFSIDPPNAEIREGCCPGPFALHGPATVEPGDETSFSFELAMHPGMDGPHDMTVHVPVTYADGTMATVDSSVSGDFRN